MNAHLIPHVILDIHCYIVVLDEADNISLSDKPGMYTGVLVQNMTEAFKIAAKHNAPLLDDGEQLLEGDFQ